MDRASCTLFEIFAWLTTCRTDERTEEAHEARGAQAQRGGHAAAEGGGQVQLFFFYIFFHGLNIGLNPPPPPT